jgi:RimJ/RimL family protein N-acetyltransferase
VAAADPPYRIETERMVLRCWDPADAGLLKEAIDASLDHLRPWMPRSATGFADETGRGLATEVAGALTLVAFEVCGVDRVEIRVEPANEPSIAVRGSLGFGRRRGCAAGFRRARTVRRRAT